MLERLFHLSERRTNVRTEIMAGLTTFMTMAELYPTRLRATGQGFCFNFGRLLAASGPLLTGYLVTPFGSYAGAVTAVSLIYLLGIIALFWARETKGRPLPD